MRSMRQFTSFLAALLLLVGCDMENWRERLTPAEEVAFAQEYLGYFAARDYVAIEALLDPELHGPNLRSQLEEVASLFPTEAPVSIRLMGSNTLRMGDVSQFNLSFEYEYPASWLVTNVVLRKDDAGVRVMGVNVYPVEESVSYTNRFTFEGKGIVHFVMLTAAVLVPLFILITLVYAFRTPMPRRKWLWILFIIAGVMPVTLDWTTGLLNLNLLSIQFFGAGFTKFSEYAPLLLTVAVPLGAVVYWVRRHHWYERIKANELSANYALERPDEN